MRGSTSFRHVAVVVLFALNACGDSTGGGPSGEQCDTPGVTDKCRCETAQLGTHTCQASGVWSACMCAAPSTKGPCVPGGLSQCNNCPGETEPRPAVCTANGKFDCSCTPLGGSDAGHDGGVWMPAADAGNHKHGNDGSDGGDSDGG